jgi:anti-anti-sigma factor
VAADRSAESRHEEESVVPKVPHPQHFKIETSQDGDTAVVRLTGELDLAGEEHLDSTVEGLEQSAGRVVVDLTEITFIDSSGLRALLRLWKRSQLNGHDFAVVAGSEQVRRTMSLTGVDGVLSFVENGDAPKA